MSGPEVDSLPWTRSYFGLEAMVGSPFAEVVSDGFVDELGADYDRRLTPSLHDPTGPSGWSGSLVGGGLEANASAIYRSLGARISILFADYRCVFEVMP